MSPCSSTDGPYEVITTPSQPELFTDKYPVDSSGYKDVEEDYIPVAQAHRNPCVCPRSLSPTMKTETTPSPTMPLSYTYVNVDHKRIHGRQQQQQQQQRQPLHQYSPNRIKAYQRLLDRERMRASSLHTLVGVQERWLATQRPLCAQFSVHIHATYGGVLSLYIMPALLICVLVCVYTFVYKC